MQRLSQFLHRLAEWLSSTPPPAPPELLPEDPALWRVRALVKEQETMDGPSGEYKRHQVYAKLLKEFPERRRRDLAYLIEVAIQEWA